MALVAGGVSAAPMTHPSTAASADVAQPVNYTTDTVDPDDKLTDSDVETARELAWANDSVRAVVDGDTPVHFDVWAPNGEDDHVSVWVEQNETTVAIADIDLDAESVLTVDEPTVLSTDETETFELEATPNSSAADIKTGSSPNETEGFAVETTLNSSAADSVFEVTTDIPDDRTVDGESDE
ncbi:hypothetical protein [Halorubrum sp. Atlit-26R]|uniref:hypothetical protein n=1 Tax=Halorubrum sp. Atlit-26R TaxID=2282128 RepID=UPI000EF193E1|nr:hypothetical protein [Halorubrum sp. Atlit-26R]RLM63662.1 hypothetical protein DVK07_15965 [Halorubrum sp. Atlit-26R]